MRTPAALVTVFLLVIFLSCSKDGTAFLNSPGIYFKDNITLTSETRVFTSTGQVKNSNIVQRFDSKDSAFYGAFRNEVYFYRGKMDSLKVTSSGIMEVNDNYQYRSYEVTSKGKNITLTARDTTAGYSYEEVYTRTLLYYLGFYKPPVFSEYLVSSTRGQYQFGYSTLQQYYLVQQDNLFNVHWVFAIAHKANGSTNFLRLQNKADLNFYKKLNTGDTVTIREYELTYDK